MQAALPVIKLGGTQEEWDTLGIPVLMVNYIDDCCFGGATVFAGYGTVVISLPLWQEGILRFLI